MATRRVSGRAARPTAAAVGCWGGCWVEGCWGGCWPGVRADPEIVEALARSMGQVRDAPEGIEALFRAAATRGRGEG
jgi:hypothetical protein